MPWPPRLLGASGAKPSQIDAAVTAMQRELDVLKGQAQKSVNAANRAADAEVLEAHKVYLQEKYQLEVQSQKDRLALVKQEQQDGVFTNTQAFDIETGIMQEQWATQKAILQDQVNSYATLASLQDQVSQYKEMAAIVQNIAGLKISGAFDATNIPGVSGGNSPATASPITIHVQIDAGNQDVDSSKFAGYLADAIQAQVSAKRSRI